MSMWHGPFGMYAFGNDEDKTRRRHFAHYRAHLHGVPRGLICRSLRRHFPVVDGYGEVGDDRPGLAAKRWVECGLCGLRPTWQGDLEPSLHPTLGARYTGPWADKADLRRVQQLRDAWLNKPLGEARGPMPDVWPAAPSREWGHDGDPGRQGPRGEVSVEMTLWAKHASEWDDWSVRLSFGGGGSETPIDAHLTLGRFAKFFIGLGGYGSGWTERLPMVDLHHTREIQVAVKPSRGRVRWSLWAVPMGDPCSDRSKRHRGVEGYLEVGQLVFGRHSMDTYLVSERQVMVPLPEGNYPATAVLRRDIRRRERFSRPRESYSVEITPVCGIPEPGKGENSWDCDDDATYSSTGPLRGEISGDEWAVAAAADLATSVMRTRSYRASATWTPDAGWPKQLITR